MINFFFKYLSKRYTLYFLHTLISFHEGGGRGEGQYSIVMIIKQFQAMVLQHNFFLFYCSQSILHQWLCDFYSQQANPQVGSTSSQPGGPIASMMGLVPGLPVAQPLMATTQMVRPVVVSALPSTSGAINNAATNMPSRLPQPGIVPAAKKS